MGNQEWDRFKAGMRAILSVPPAKAADIRGSVGSVSPGPERRSEPEPKDPPPSAPDED